MFRDVALLDGCRALVVRGFGVLGEVDAGGADHATAEDGPAQASEQDECGAGRQPGSSGGIEP